MEIIRPPRLRQGDRIHIVAASGPVKVGRLKDGLRILEERYRLCYDETALQAKWGFLAGEDALRLRSLNGALADPECRAVFLARGGYGLLRILPWIDVEALRAHPKPIVGYSDVTALLALSAGAGVAAIHGPMLAQLGTIPPGDLEALFTLLEDPDPGILMTDLEEIKPGRAEGPLLGGNLEVLTRLLGTPYAPEFAGSILFLEEIGEAPYRIDRLITHLHLAGVLASVAGVVIGELVDCDEVEEGVVKPPTAREVLIERLAGLEVPVALGGAFGHGKRNLALPYGTRVALETKGGTLTALEGAVS